MTRSRLRYKYLKHKAEKKPSYILSKEMQCLSLFRKIGTNYYEILDEKDITDNKKIWIIVQPLLPDKSINRDKIRLNENGEFINSE